MRVSRPALLFFLLYVALDFSNPLIPGAVSFDPDESVEAVRAGRVVAPADGAAATPAPASTRVDPTRRERQALARLPAPGTPRERLTHARRTPAPASALGRSEDH